MVNTDTDSAIELLTTKQIEVRNDDPGYSVAKWRLRAAVITVLEHAKQHLRGKIV